MTIFTEFRSAMRKRAAYKRTVEELRAMPLEVAIDLDIYQPEAAKLARRAVYGA